MTDVGHRNKHVRAIWAWLPAFRVVAECEHLPTAAQRLHLTPSALSRTLKLVEDEIGHPLFDRQHGRLALNARGRRLLSAVRDGMRRVDDALVDIGAQGMAGPVRVSAPSAFAATFVLPAFDALRLSHPLLEPELTSVPSHEVGSALLEGRLDLALLDDPLPHGDLVIERVSRLRYGVYCGHGHPLHRARRLSIKDLERHSFAAGPEGADDHWPPHLRRTVSMRLAYLYLGVEACALGQVLAVLPDVVVRGDRRLRRLPIEVCDSTWLLAARRVETRSPDLAMTVLDAIRGAVDEPRRRRVVKKSSTTRR